MKLYAGSIQATEYRVAYNTLERAATHVTVEETKITIVHHSAIAFQAENEHEALQVALHTCDQFYPNYDKHSVAVCEVML